MQDRRQDSANINNNFYTSRNQQSPLTISYPNIRIASLLVTNTLIPRVVSVLLFQSSSQKTTLVQGAILDGEFDFIVMKFQMAVRVLFGLSP